VSAVVFWDVDGTLLTTGRAGILALEQAAEEICGTRPDLSELPTAGLTDDEIAVTVVARCAGTGNAATTAALLRRYETHLPARLHDRRGRVLPGVREVLDDLAARDDVACLLLTGNTEAGARAKLAHYGLDGYFSAGAFSRAGASREAIAARAAELAGPAPPGQGRYVIGDTPHDVRCGQAIGARTVAVATGTHDRAELAACDPWLALEALPPPAEFAELLEL
jgi:phosphoglycolate phosphatase-like HAD superfamily hydrolase